MFAFVVGTACLFGLVAVIRHGRHGSRHWGHGHFRGGRGGFGPRRMLRRLFERLDTTPGQEKAIASALDDFKREAKSARAELEGARGEVASALRQDVFDEVLLGAALTRVDNTVDVMRKAALDAFGKVHGALDEQQRAKLADFIERSPGRPFEPAHPYRL
jgi:uncharacterized membrane protein